MEMSMDIVKFNGDLARIMTREIPEAAGRGLGKAGMQFLRDAAMIEPTIPHDEGTLRGSGSAFVQNKLIGTTGGNAATSINESIRNDQLEMVAGLNSPYAAYQHEGVRQDGTHRVRNYTEPGAGPKFFEAKLMTRKDIYMAIVAGEIKRA